MKTASIELDEAFFGEILEYCMPVPNVFYVVGRRGASFLLLPEAIGTVVSPEAAAYGQPYPGGLTVIDEDEFEGYPIRYELADYFAKHCADIHLEAACRLWQDELRPFGQLELPGYFGDFPLPLETPRGPIEESVRIAQGFFMLRDTAGWLLCVAELAQECTFESFISFCLACSNGYFFFDLAALPPERRQAAEAALALFPLAPLEVNPALFKRFPAYAALFERWRQGDSF